MPWLEKWGLSRRPSTDYQAPENWPWVVSGEVHDSAGFNDGDHITTSRIVKIKEYGNSWAVITRSGTYYALGEPHTDFLKVLENKGESLEQAMIALKSHTTKETT